VDFIDAAAAYKTGQAWLMQPSLPLFFEMVRMGYA